MLSIQKLLCLLLCYIFDCDYDDSLDYSNHKFSGEPVKQRQVIFKESGVLDLLMDIVYYPIEHGHYNIRDIHKPLYVSKILCLSFVNIKSGIMEYRPSELHASQWLKMMIEYSHQDRTNILRVKDTLTELIDNNEKILTTSIRHETFV